MSDRLRDELTEHERATLLTPCACGHTINNHGSLIACWLCEEDDQGECATTFEALLVERIESIVATTIEARIEAATSQSRRESFREHMTPTIGAEAVEHALRTDCGHEMTVLGKTHACTLPAGHTIHSDRDGVWANDTTKAHQTGHDLGYQAGFAEGDARAREVGGELT